MTKKHQTRHNSRVYESGRPPDTPTGEDATATKKATDIATEQDTTTSREDAAATDDTGTDTGTANTIGAGTGSGTAPDVGAGSSTGADINIAGSTGTDIGGRAGTGAGIGSGIGSVLDEETAATVPEPRLRPGGCELADGTPIPAETARRMACAAGVVALLCDRNGHPLEISDLTRYPSTATERAVRARDRDTCRFPGCHTRSGLDLHHIIHWAHGGQTTLANLLQLCRQHHWLVHEAGFTITNHANDHAAGRQQLIFRQPDGTPIPPTGPQLDLCTADGNGLPETGPPEVLQPLIGAPTLDPDPLTPPWWNGDPLNLDYTVSVITEAQQRTRTAKAA